MQLQSASSQEMRLLRFGGAAGIAAGLLFILVPVTLFGFQPSVPAGSLKTEGGGTADPSALVALFPSSQTAIAAGNMIDFFSDVLFLALFLSLFFALRKTRLAEAVLGCSLGVLGLGVLFTETMTQVAFDPLSSAYHTPGATAAQQATLALVWEATQGLLYELDSAAVLLMATALIVLGAAMLRAPGFEGKVGGFSVVLGITALVTISVLGVTSTIAAALLIPIFVIVPIAWGRKVLALSKS